MRVPFEVPNIVRHPNRDPQLENYLFKFLDRALIRSSSVKDTASAQQGLGLAVPQERRNAQLPTLLMQLARLPHQAGRDAAADDDGGDGAVFLSDDGTDDLHDDDDDYDDGKAATADDSCSGGDHGDDDDDGDDANVSNL